MEDKQLQLQGRLARLAIPESYGPEAEHQVTDLEHVDYLTAIYSSLTELTLSVSDGCSGCQDDLGGLPWDHQETLGALPRDHQDIILKNLPRQLQDDLAVKVIPFIYNDLLRSSVSQFARTETNALNLKISSHSTSIMKELYTPEIGKRILSTHIKSHFQNNTWLTAGTVQIVHYIILSATSDSEFKLMVPPLMTMLHYHDPSIKLMGAQCLHSIISISSPTRLREGNLFAVFASDLMDTSHWIDQPLLFESSLDSLIILRKAYIKDTPEYFSHLESILRGAILANSVYMNSNSPSLPILLNHTAQLVPLLSVHAFKFMQQIVEVALEALDAPKLNHVALNVLYVVIVQCWAGMDKIASMILVAIAECWKCSIGDWKEMQKVVGLLMNCGNQVRTDAKVLLMMDDGLYKGMFESVVLEE